MVLLRVGFTLPLPLPGTRCALTAPFHPYPGSPLDNPGRYVFCGTFRRLTPPRRYLAPCPVEPGLSSALLRRKPLTVRSRLQDRGCPANSKWQLKPVTMIVQVLLKNQCRHDLPPKVFFYKSHSCARLSTVPQSRSPFLVVMRWLKARPRDSRRSVSHSAESPPL